MVKWEYFCYTIYADIDFKGVKEFLSENYPKFKSPKHHVKTLEAQLEKFGANGWELVHIEPISLVGDKGDLGYSYPEYTDWRRFFFCVFKRPYQNINE